ncbi:MAG: uroporphyrinogen decarboxylase family protein [Armatimonadota bacterium]|nr:uroporphyrinogen decarboxylase family protein [Armatimonadota bacterium]
MNPAERIVAACQHRPYDRVPTYHASFSSRIASIILGREAYVGGGVQQWREAVALWNGPEAHAEFLERSLRDAVDLGTILDLDMVRVAYWREPEKPAKRIDEFTFFYGDPDGKWRVMRYDPRTELYQMVDHSPHYNDDLDLLDKEVECMELAVQEYGPTPESFPEISRALTAYRGFRAVPLWGVSIGIPYGSRAWMEAVVLRPDLVERLLDVQVERARKTIQAAAPLGVRVVLGGMDLANNQGPMYSPDVFRKLVLPRLKQIVEFCHQFEMYYFFASDGNLWPIADDVFPVVDGYYEIDRRAGMDLRKLRERFPHLTLVGNISSHTLHLGTREEVIEETLSCINAARELGSIVVGCSNLIVSETPEENLFAMLDTLETYR